MISETKQEKWYVLKTLGADDTALVWSGSSQTVDNVGARGSTVERVELPRRANGVLVIMHGYHATAPEDKTMAWMLIGWRFDGGPAEFIANGTATLGTQRVAAGTATEMWADTIAITAQKWPKTISIIDSGNNRIAKLAFDLCGISDIACVMQKTTTTTTGAKISWF